MTLANASDLVDLPARRIAGIAQRSSYDTIGVDAGALWQRAFREGVATGLVHAVYYDYASDFRGAYTMMIGGDLGDAPVPAGRASMIIPAGRYARIAADGDPTVVITRAWQHIHAEWPLRDRRVYGADFEVHGIRGPGTADIYVGVV
jgi:predicted transcriptional regulator YdeE